MVSVPPAIMRYLHPPVGAFFDLVTELTGKDGIPWVVAKYWLYVNLIGSAA